MKNTTTPAPMMGQPMPASPNAEATILGALMLDSTAYFLLQTSQFALNVADFHHLPHAKIWEVIERLGTDGFSIDLVTVAEALTKAGYINAVGGYFYLVELTNKVASSANIEHHAAILKQYSTRRKTIEACNAAMHSAYDTTADPLETLGAVQRGLADVSNGIGKAAVDGAKLVELTHAKATQKELLDLPTKTGFYGLDEALGGGVYSDDFVTLLGGRPGTGKTAFALGLALEKLKQGKPFAFFSYEMPAQTLMIRLFAIHSQIPAQQLRLQQLSEADLVILESTKQWFAARAHLIHLFDCEGMDLGLLTAKIAKAKQDGIEDIFIDHFGEIPNPEKANEELGNAVKIRTIRNTAKSLGLRVYLLVQFRKASNGLALSKPTLSDIKGSSVIGECAAITLFLHAQEEGRFVLIEKARNAGVGEVAMDYFGPCFTWSSLDGGAQDSFEFDADNFGQNGIHTSHEQDQHPDTEFDQFSAF